MPFFFSYLPPMAAHSQLGEAEGQKDIDAVHDDQQPYVSTGIKEKGEGGQAHAPDAVLHN